MSNVTLDGNPIELSGKFPQPGDNVPPFTLTSSGLEEASLASPQSSAISFCSSLSITTSSSCIL